MWIIWLIDMIANVAGADPFSTVEVEAAIAAVVVAEAVVIRSQGHRTGELRLSHETGRRLR